jgi:hypothetical protein
LNDKGVVEGSEFAKLKLLGKVENEGEGTREEDESRKEGDIERCSEQLRSNAIGVEER